VSIRRTSERGTFAAPDGLEIYWETDRPENPRAAVLLVHGYAEHCGRYAEVATKLVERGFAVWRFDYRGHGRSGGRRGHCYHFEDYFGELRAMRDRMFAGAPDRPRFIAGHSHGGLLTTHFISREPEGLNGFALSSPFFGFGIRVPTWKAIAGRTLSRFVPALSMPTDIDPGIVSHDPEVVRAYGADPLNGKNATARWFTEMLRVQPLSEAAARGITLPALVQQAGDDRLAAPAATRAVFEALASADKKYLEYPGLYHELWFELDRERTIGELVGWLENHL